MMFDAVHDIQRASRKMVKALSFPGTLENLLPEAEKLDGDLPVTQVLLLLAMTLLDGEVTFAVESEQKATQEELISRLTYSRAVAAENADFVFVPDADFPSAAVIGKLREGDLVDPHRGATLILGAASLDNGNGLVLSGPGIRDTEKLAVTREPSWVEARNRKNREYPMGVDLFLVTDGGQLAALPRTTKIRADRSA
jgi:alpha-D-ribose 1-methylphosphonate 5-triphosphate synthase subunit PhnH